MEVDSLDRGHSSIFVVWDTQIAGLDALLETLKLEGYHALGTLPQGGDISHNVLTEGVTEAARVLAFVDLPNVNVGFEIGYALGLPNKPIALVHTTSSRPEWVKLSPLAGIACHRVTSRKEVLLLPKDAFMVGPEWTADGRDTLFLCSGGMEGSALQYLVQQEHGDWRVLPDQGWNLSSLPEQLSGIGQVVLALPQPTEEVRRDSKDDARNALIAGYAEARGATVQVITHVNRRAFADLEGRAHRYGSIEEFRRILPSVRSSFENVLSQRHPAPERAVQLSLIDFSPLLRRKLQDFVGRRWLVQQVDDFLRENDRGYVLIKALPGMGKTTFAAHLVQERGWIHHFFTRAQGIVSFDMFVRSLRAQLVEIFNIDIEEPGRQDVEHGLYLERMLEITGAVVAPEGRYVVIVIDGLDEAEPVEKYMQPLFLPTTLPPGIKLIVLGRYRAGAELRVDMPALDLEIDPAAPENMEDLRSFLEHASQGPLARVLTGDTFRREAFVEQVLEASKGNFMYARALVDDVLHHKLDSTNLKRLPRGLEGYYEQHWELLRQASSPQLWDQRMLPVLCVLSVADVPLDVPDLRTILSMGLHDTAGIGNAEILSVLERWGQFLAREPGPRGPRFQLYHRSFQDFLQTKEEVSGELVKRNVSGWIADALLQRYSEKENE